MKNIICSFLETGELDSIVLRVALRGSFEVVKLDDMIAVNAKNDDEDEFSSLLFINKGLDENIIVALIMTVIG